MKQPILRILMVGAAFTAMLLLITIYQFVVWQQFKKEYEQTISIVLKNKIDKERKFYPVLRFRTLDNQKITFTATTLSSKLKYNEGDTIMIYYDLLNADDVHIAGDEYRGLLIIGLLTSLLGLLSGYGFWHIRQSTQHRTFLINTGKILTAKISSTKQDALLGGLLPIYKIICEYESLSGEKQTYESRSFTQNPSPLLSTETLKVYLDKDDPQHYFVDVTGFAKDSFLY